MSANLLEALGVLRAFTLWKRCENHGGRALSQRCHLAAGLCVAGGLFTFPAFPAGTVDPGDGASLVHV